MSMRSLGAAILAELRTVTNTPKIRQKDITAWQCGQGVEVSEGEQLAWLPTLQVSVAYMLPAKKK